MFHAQIAGSLVQNQQVALKNHIARVGSRQAVRYCKERIIGGNRTGHIALFQTDITDPGQNSRQAMLQQAVGGIGGGQTFGDREASLVGGKRIGEIALQHLYITDPVMAEHQAILPSAVTRIGFQECLADCKAGLVGGKRSGKIALRHTNVADPFVRYRQAVLQFRVGGVRRRQTLANCKASLISGKRTDEITFCFPGIADIVVGNRQAKLPAGIGRIGTGPSFCHHQLRLERIRSGTNISGGHVDTAERPKRQDLLVHVFSWHIPVFELRIKCRCLLVVGDGELVLQFRRRRTAVQVVGRRFRQGPFDIVRLQRFARARVDIRRLAQLRPCAVKGAERQLPFRRAAQSGHALISGTKRAKLVAHLGERSRRLAQLLGPLLAVEAGDIAADQRAIERRQRHAGVRCDALHVFPHLRADIGHGKQQPLALGQLAGSLRGEEQRRQAAFHIGQLRAARALVDLLLHQRQHRADFQPVGAEIFGQRRRERRIVSLAVGRRFARCGGKGKQRVLGAAEAPQTGLDRRRQPQRLRAAPLWVRGYPEGIVAAGVEHNQRDVCHLGRRPAQFLQRQRTGLQCLQRRGVGVGRQQAVLAGDFDAVAGEEDQGDVGARRILGKILQRPAHAAQIAVGLGKHLETECVERLLDRARIVDGIGERTDRLIAIGAEDKRHAPFREGRACRDDNKYRRKDDPHRQSPKPRGRKTYSNSNMAQARMFFRGGVSTFDLFSCARSVSRWKVPLDRRVFCPA